MPPGDSLMYEGSFIHSVLPFKLTQKEIYYLQSVAINVAMEKLLEVDKNLPPLFVAFYGL